MARARIGWATADPVEAERAIRAAIGGLELSNGTLELVPPLAGDLPLDFDGRGGPGLGAVAGPAPVLVGLAWATVDRERAAAELADAIPGLLARGFVAAATDPHLGAHALVAVGPRAAADDGDGLESSGQGEGAAQHDAARRVGERVEMARLVLLEPATEGRLAGALARYGEGPIGLYVARAAAGSGGGSGDDDGIAGVGAAGVTATGVGVGAAGVGAAGPFGPSRLVRTPDRFGPFLVLVDGEFTPPASAPRG